MSLRLTVSDLPIWPGAPHFSAPAVAEIPTSGGSWWNERCRRLAAS